MLTEFIRDNRAEIVARARLRVARRAAPRPTQQELTRGLPLFLDELAEALRAADECAAIGSVAAEHGAHRSRDGFTIAQVVHDYGDLCQAITELAQELNAPIPTADFHRLNECLDQAIAHAVTEYARFRESSRDHAEAERLGMLAHELRNRINSAMLAYGMLKTGQLDITGSTAGVLDRSLLALQELITRSLVEVRVNAGIQHRERVNVAALVEELEAEGSLFANTRRVQFTVAPVDASLEVDADRQLLSAAVTNLLTNAFKFTRDDGHVSLRTSATDDRVTFEVEDECGGLPTDDSDALFEPWIQRSGDRRGLGLGLPLVRKSVRALGGEVTVRNLPGKGCVFAIAVRRAAARRDQASA